MTKYDLVQQKANLLRKWSMIATTEAASGHPTSCMSAADISAMLFDRYFSYDIKNPLNPHNDRFILSKGHAAPLFYALFAMSGAMPLEELKTLRKFTSRLEGHPTPHFPYTDAATGSLGQGVSVGAGMAYLSKKEQISFKTYVVTGDGELAEGQVWEACNFASYYGLDNLVVIADINRLGQSQQTMFDHHTEQYVARFQGFGFHTLAIDGHNFLEIEKAFEQVKNNTTGKPIAIVAKTYKGKGVSFLENKDNWHGKALKKEDLEKALAELGPLDDNLKFTLPLPQSTDTGVIPNMTPPVLQLPYKKGEEIATRDIYGTILAKMANTNQAIYSLDGDTKNSTFSIDFLKAFPDHFIECFIAEQNMVGVAMGISRMQRKPFVSTFAAFLMRAADQIRMASISRASIAFVGSHAGVSIGEDGPSQMALEDLALFGTIPGAVIFQPSDAVSTAKVLSHLVAHPGISYLRTLRPKTPVLYDTSEQFPVGGSKILRNSKQDVLTVVASGITVHEALKAADVLAKENILIRVVDCYSLKPIDEKTLQRCIAETQKPILVTVEDHSDHGGLGDFVLSAVSITGAHVYKLAVTHISRSGLKDELMADANIDARAIVTKVKELLT